MSLDHSLINEIKARLDLRDVVEQALGPAARQVRWLAQLPTVLIAFDTDPPGERAAQWWLNVLPNAQRWRPIGAKDPNDMLIKAGMDLRLWLAPALGLETPPPAAAEVKPEGSLWQRLMGREKR